MLEGQRQLLETRVPDLGVKVLGTSKTAQIIKTGREYGGAWRVVNPEDYGPEPNTDDANIQSTHKTGKVIENHPQDIKGKATAFAADVVFKRPADDGLITHHKPQGANGEMTLEEKNEYIRETQEWYSDAFVVYWFISFAVENTEGMKKLATLKIRGEYDDYSVPWYEVSRQFNPNINARLPLVEMGKDGNAKFFISNLGEADETEIEISQELAEQLIVARVLPIQSVVELLTQESEELILEQWMYIYLTLTGLAEQVD